MPKLDKNLKILIGIGLISIIGIGVWGINAQLEIEKLTSTGISNLKTKAPIEKKALLIIDEGKQAPRKFEIETDEKTTVFDLLKQTGIALDYTEYDIGIFIDAIGGIWNDKKENKYWMYYINGETPMVSVDKKEIKSGDKVEFKFEKSPF